MQPNGGACFYWHCWIFPMSMKFQFQCFAARAQNSSFQKYSCGLVWWIGRSEQTPGGWSQTCDFLSLPPLLYMLQTSQKWNKCLIPFTASAWLNLRSQIKQLIPLDSVIHKWKTLNYWKYLEVLGDLWNLYLTSLSRSQTNWTSFSYHLNPHMQIPRILWQLQTLKSGHFHEKIFFI